MLSQRVPYSYAFIIVLLCFTAGCIVTLFLIFCFFANKKPQMIHQKNSIVNVQLKNSNSLPNLNECEQSKANKVELFEIKNKSSTNHSSLALANNIANENEPNIDIINELESTSKRISKRTEINEPMDEAGDSAILSDNFKSNSNNELIKLDLANIKSKYRSGLAQSPRFKNYLHKSKRPFIGYESNSIDNEITEQLPFTSKSKKRLSFEEKLKSK
jgi:hypothetical protein